MNIESEILAKSKNKPAEIFFRKEKEIKRA